MPRPTYITCKNCRKWRYACGRGLCATCYKNRAVRDQYPAEPTVNRGRQNGTPEPTEVELDAMIEERRPTMPGN